MAELALAEPIEKESTEHKWTIENRASSQRVNQEIRSLVNQKISDEISAFDWIWFADELITNEIKHGQGIEDAINGEWPKISSVEVKISIGSKVSDLSVDSLSTIVPPNVLNKYFTISNPTIRNYLGSSETVFSCRPKPVSEFPIPTLDDLTKTSGRGYRLIAAFLNQPDDQLDIILPTKAVNDNKWPLDTPVQHRVEVHATTLHLDKPNTLNIAA